MLLGPSPAELARRPRPARPPAAPRPRRPGRRLASLLLLAALAILGAG